MLSENSDAHHLPLSFSSEKEVSLPRMRRIADVSPGSRECALDLDRARLNSRLRDLSRPLYDDVQPVEIDSGSDNADIACIRAEEDVSARITEVLSARLDRARRALERLEEGLYGSCEDCGRQISADRLKAIPEATRCVSCQESRDRRSAG